MKNGIYFLLLAVCLFTKKSNAQSAAVKLNIVFNHVQNLTINPLQTETTLVYNTQADYENGVETVQKEHLTVFSTAAYVVKVRVADEEFVQTAGLGQQHMSLPNITISAIPVVQGNRVLVETKVLGTDGRSIISSDNAALNDVYDVSYRGPGGNLFLDYVSKNGQNVFSNTVLYSIETK